MIIQRDANGRIIGKYDSVAQAGAETDITTRNIYSVLAGDRKTAGGFYWEKVDDDEQDTPESRTEWSESTDEARFSGVIRGKNVTTLEELLEFCQVNLDRWEVKRHTIKTWHTTLKRKGYIDTATADVPVKGKGFVGKPLPTHDVEQILNVGFTVEFALRSDFKEQLVEMLKTHIQPVFLKKPLQRQKGKYVVEFAIFDHHLGKEGFDAETLQHNWSIETAMEQYQKVIEFGLSKVDIDNVHEFLLPTGNDLINVDSVLGSTTSGTKVGSDTFWLNLFRYSKEAVSQAIQMLQQYAPVKAIFIPGNHDHNGVLALSEVIKAMFQHNTDVDVICSGRGREWYDFGNNLLGWHHGDRCDAKKAHTMMIADVPHLIKKNQYRAMHVGHTHRSAKTETVSLLTSTEEFGLTYEICPSLSPLDKWHDANLFIGNLRRSKIFGYEYDRGHEFEFIYNLK